MKSKETVFYNGSFELPNKNAVPNRVAAHLSREDINRMKTNCKNEKRFHYEFYKNEFSEFMNEIGM